MAFVSSPSTNSTNEVYTAYGISTASTQSSTAINKVSTDSSQTSTANLSDANVYAFLSNQSNGSQLVHEDLEQIYEDDLEEMDLKWQASRIRLFIKGKKNVRMILDSIDNGPLVYPTVEENGLYNLFNKFAYVPGETLYEYYWRFSQLINDMHTIGKTM
nr:hypothetical protein [Tanacetum cinerariifolium]